MCSPLHLLLQVSEARVLVQGTLLVADKVQLKIQHLCQRPGHKGWRASKRATDQQKDKA